MSIKDVLRKMINDYFIICTGVLIFQVVPCLIFYPDSVFSLTELSYIIFGGAIFTLPHLIFWSKNEMSKKQFRWRFIIHFIILEILVISYAHLVGWIEGGFILLEDITTMISVLLIYMIVRLSDWRKDQAVSQLINEKLAEFRKNEK